MDNNRAQVRQSRHVDGIVLWHELTRSIDVQMANKYCNFLLPLRIDVVVQIMELSASLPQVSGAF